MSHITCLMSHVLYHMSHVTFFFSFLESGSVSWWRVCYQRGLPRLVLPSATLPPAVLCQLPAALPLAPVSSLVVDVKKQVQHSPHTKSGVRCCQLFFLLYSIQYSEVFLFQQLLYSTEGSCQQLLHSTMRVVSRHCRLKWGVVSSCCRVQ